MRQTSLITEKTVRYLHVRSVLISQRYISFVTLQILSVTFLMKKIAEVVEVEICFSAVFRIINSF